jgi:protein-S-isoprenylcysteine O-methyltransferase Ste14
MNRENLVALLHALSGVAVMVVSLFTKTELLISVGFVKLAGFLILFLGMLLFAFAAACLGKGFFGNVQPVCDNLVTSGPYRLVRHPVYLGMILSVFGLAVGMRSIWGLLITLLLFAPIGVYRARLEERWMAQKFGTAWEEYVRRTYFMFPLIY